MPRAVLGYGARIDVGHLHQRLRVLSIEDDAPFSELIRRKLEVISDHNMPGFDSEEALCVVKARRLDPPFIVVSGHIGEDAAVAVMRAGAHDY